MDFKIDYDKQTIFYQSIKDMNDVNFFRMVDDYCMNECDNIFADVCDNCPIRHACDKRYENQK